VFLLFYEFVFIYMNLSHLYLPQPAAFEINNSIHLTVCKLAHAVGKFLSQMLNFHCKTFQSVRLQVYRTLKTVSNMK
jgi:hypothetical protein